MGCWDETCGLTNTPIYGGDPAVLVVFDISVVDHGLHPGWSFADQVIAIHRGPYNGYGGVGDVMPRTGDVAGILFHRDAWDACVTVHGEAKEENAAAVDAANGWRKVNGKEPIVNLGEFTAVMQVAYVARRDVLSGLKFRGMQDCNAMEPYWFVWNLERLQLERQSLHRRSAGKERQ